jgi:cytochrome c-type biogenesis protein CcmF
MLALTPAAESTTSLIMFTFVAFLLGVVVQEFARGVSARRVMTGEAVPAAFAHLITRNRRRYGGYLVHAGIAILFLGVAASSAFIQQRDVRLRPGQSADVGDYTITYVKPTAAFLNDRAHTGAPISLGAVLDVRKGNEHFTFRPAHNYYPASDGSGGPIGRWFEGESTSEVDLKWGLKRDFWTAVQPDIRELRGPIAEANRRFGQSSGTIQTIAIAAITESYLKRPTAANFRAISSPLIAWIWIGGAVAVLGALTALWPTPEARRRRAASLAKARLGRELSRA